MKVFRATDAPFRSADRATFTGGARTARVAADDAGTPVHIYKVAFEPGGRTNWHVHSGPQWLLVIEGQVRVQSHGDRLVDLGVGDAVVFAPGEKHWHGAAPTTAMTHIAIQESLDGKVVEWMEKVTDAQYQQ